MTATHQHAMKPRYSEAAWVDKFVMHLSQLGVRAEPQMIASMGHELYETQGENDPIHIAQAEWDSWPPHDD